MDSRKISHIEKKLAYEVIPALIGAFGQKGSQRHEPSALYDEALKRLIQWITGCKRPTDEYVSFDVDALYKEVKALDVAIETLPTLYERLRDYEFPEKGQWSKPRKNRNNKRNQGLFYTPENIVDYIVERSFVAFEEHSPEVLEHVKILDPSMGAGLFLQAAMDKLARCFQQGKLQAPGASFHEMNYASILEKNLYGVDLDEVAVLIAKALLANKAGAFNPSAQQEGITRNLKTGNSLIGAVDTNGRGREFHDARLAGAYLKGRLSDDQIRAWTNEIRPVHWGVEFPDVFNRPNPGFDMIIGNPPYETLSVKESGIRVRKREQDYFRHIYKSCHGKINLYRLMIERSLELLRQGGVLGFIIPVTLLADTTAKKLRGLIFDQTDVKEAVIIPEKARVFHGVTQACLILIGQKGRRTKQLKTSHWLGLEKTAPAKGVSIPMDIIESCGLRVPILETIEEKELFLAVNRFPPLGGDNDHPPLAQARQGEINMTVNRDWITTEPSGYPLIRGEHVAPFRIRHPAENCARLDWVKEAYVAKLLKDEQKKQELTSEASDSAVWQKERIVVARVVNIGSKIRLKAAKLKPYYFQGDMTNCLFGLNIDMDFLIGLLNSSLLNWRFKKTSANNYISMAEIMALPAPRLRFKEGADLEPQAQSILESFIKDTNLSMGGVMGTITRERGANDDHDLIFEIIKKVSIMSQSEIQGWQRDRLKVILDGIAPLLYGVEKISGPLRQ